MMSQINSQAEDRRRIRKIAAERLTDLIATDPAQAAAVLGDLALCTLARAYPAELTESTKTRIKSNYPPATDDLMAERAMSPLGIELALALTMEMATIVLDYSPRSDVAHYLEQDAHAPPEIVRSLSEAVEVAIANAERAGMSRFGARTTTILVAVATGIGQMVPFEALGRPLLRGMAYLLEGMRQERSFRR